MKLYFPEANANQFNYVGYNHAVSLFRKALCEHLVQDPDEADFRIYCNLPWHHDPESLKTNGLPILAYTMYETSRVPASWVKFLNQHVSVVCVPSHWTKEVFEGSGVKRPIFVLSLGVDEERFRVAVPKTKSEGQYVFIWQGVALDYGGRKGVDLALDAFKQLRKERRLGEDARLIVKFRPYEKRNFTMDHVETPSGVIYVQRNMTDAEIRTLYENVDCCINPTHGEGFGLIPLEQMAMGKPVLVTDWSMDYVQSGVCIPLAYSLLKSVITWNHRHLYVGLNGLSYNFGGIGSQWIWLPHLIPTVPDGKRYKPLVLDESAPLPIEKGPECLFPRVNNFLHNFQMKTGLFFKGGRKPFRLYQEDPGLDATVDLEDLKNKMEWCYCNREKAFDIGFQGREHVLHNWTLDRMQLDFMLLEQAIEKLKKE